MTPFSSTSTRLLSLESRMMGRLQRLTSRMIKALPIMDIQRQRMSCYRNQRPIVIVCSVPITTDGLLLQNHDASRVKARRGAFSRYLAWLVWRESLASFPLILGVADKPAEQTVTTILCPPEVGGQSKANQTERRHQDLL